MTTPSVPAIDYSSRDYIALTTSMLDYASQVIPEWTSRSPADFGMMLVELMAYQGDILSYAIDRAASEAFLGTAVQRSSVLAHAALMGYRPSAATPSTTTLQFTTTGAVTVTIPAGTQVATTSDQDNPAVYFETTQAITITAPTASGTVAAIEGETVASEAIGTSDGSVGQQFVLQQTPVIESSILLTVQDDPTRSPRTWTFVDNLVTAGSDDEVFTTDTTVDGITILLFGNNVTGKVPARGATIVVTYRIGGGVRGNVAANTVVLLVSAVDGVLAVTNTVAATGGADVESTASIKVNAPPVFRAANRAVTLDDHAALALRVSGVSKAKALSSVYTNVTIFLAPSGGGTPTALLVSQASSFVQARALVGVSVRAAGVTYVPINVTASIVVFPQYNRESVRTAALAAINAWLGFDNMQIGYDISQADIYSVIMSTEGVQSASISLLSTSGSGVGDITIQDWQMADAGALQVGASGGVLPGASTTDIFGATPGNPSPTAAPTVTATCAGSSVSLNVSWSAAALNTAWFVEVFYKDGGGATLADVSFGSFATTTQAITAGLQPGATSMQVRIQSFNGTTGPVYSPLTTVAYPC